jgi:flagellar hook-associated protein 2
VLDGEDVGMDNTVSIDATTTLTGFAEVDFGTTAPLNSSLDVNGITVTGSSNNVEIIDGLTVNLKTVPDDPVTISATRDTGALKTKLEAIVEKANAFLGFLAEQSEYDAKTKTAGVLSGDALATGIGRKVRTAFGLEVSGGVHQSLGDLGISFNSEGRVELDDSVLKTALDENPLAVRDLLRSTNVTEPNGLMSKLSSVLSPYTEEEGPLKTRLETLDSIVERADERLLALNARSEKYRVRLEAQFLRMEQSLAALSGTQSFFATNQIGLY